MDEDLQELRKKAGPLAAMIEERADSFIARCMVDSAEAKFMLLFITFKTVGMMERGEIK